MWDRGELKALAKTDLKRYYWLAFLVSLIGVVLGAHGLGGGASASFNFRFSGSSGSSGGSLPNSYGESAYTTDAAFAMAAIGLFVLIMLVVAVFVVVYSAFIGNIVSVGIARFYITAPEGKPEISTMLYGFQQGRWMKLVKSMFITNLSIFLWSMLFVIPGIYKSYQYRFVPALLGENPDLSAEEAMEISKQMTEGHKMDMWVLDMSFIGWYMLGALVFGIGVLFVNPYSEATWAQLYLRLRKNQQPENTDYIPPAYH